MKIEILPATIDRIEGFWRAMDVVAQERRYLMFTEAPPLEMMRSFVSDLINKGLSQFYALYDDVVVGWCDIVRGDRGGTKHSGFLEIGIIPDHRGKGIGRRLLKATIDDAFSKGIERVELEVFASNQRAIRLYRKFGFLEEGRKRHARLFDCEYDDIVIMALLK